MVSFIFYNMEMEVVDEVRITRENLRNFVEGFNLAVAHSGIAIINYVTYKYFPEGEPCKLQNWILSTKLMWEFEDNSKYIL